MEGLLGLTKSINSSENAIRDLSILERMDARLQQDRNSELQAQQQEQLMYENIHKMSNQLLEKDRKAINKRIALFQGQISKEIKQSGGSSRSFMESGGLSVMSRISNDITSSNEVITAQENKQNLFRILEMQAKGLGHLITPKDMKSLEDYNKNENGGRISFSGVMSEIKIPPSELFDYNTEIPIEAIMSYDQNMMKLISNYKLNNPEAPEPNASDIRSFALEMGYGGMGSNQTKLKERIKEGYRRRQRAAKLKATSGRTSNKSYTSKKPEKVSYLNKFATFKSQIESDLTVKDILSNEDNGGYIEQLKVKGDRTIGKFIHKKNKLVSRKRRLNEEGIDASDFLGDADPNTASLGERMFNEKYGLKDSYQFMPESTNKVITRLLGKTEEGGAGFEIKNGTIIGYEPEVTSYRMDGVQLSGNNKLEAGVYKGSYKVEGIYTAFKTGDENGTSKLLMNAYDDDGETIDKGTTSKINQAYLGEDGSGEVVFTTVIALRNENNGDLYYKEIDLGKQDTRRALQNAIGEDDSMTESVAEENRDKSFMDTAKAIDREDEIEIRDTMSYLQDNVFQDAAFEREGANYYGADSGGQLNRYDLMRSFYTAFDHVKKSKHAKGKIKLSIDEIQKYIDSGIFTQNAIVGNIEDSLKDYSQGNNNQKIINLWLRNANEEAENDLQKSENIALAQKWFQILKFEY